MNSRRLFSPARFSRIFPAFLSASLLFCASPASARKQGFATGICEGCHGETDNSSLSATPLTANPGETVTLQIVLSDPDAKVGGLFLETDDLEGVSIPGGQSIVLVSTGVTHTSPTPLANGSVTFELTYQVPPTMGATHFSVWTVAANGNDDDTGDEVNQHEFGLVYGCEPQTFYADLDRDGHGRDAPTRTDCAGTPPDGFAVAPDDCNDNDASENPSAMELCNGVDDNCNGEADEGAVPVELFPDADGDGYYSNAERVSGDSVIGCLPYPGYANKPGDCEPNAANAHPGAEEVCDLRLDEDCDGNVDERVKPFCGEGACKRESWSCTVEDCTPGQPSEEVCNFIDDDCDGDLDEGDLCPSGQECLAGSCREAGSIPPGPNAVEQDTSGADTGNSASSGSCSLGSPGPRGRSGLPLSWLLGAAASLVARRRRHSMR